MIKKILSNIKTTAITLIKEPMKTKHEKKLKLLKNHYQQTGLIKSKLLEIDAALEKTRQVIIDNAELIDTASPLINAYQTSLAHFALGSSEAQDTELMAKEIYAAKASDDQNNLSRVTSTEIAQKTISGLEAMKVSYSEKLPEMKARDEKLNIDILQDIAEEHAKDYEKYALLAIDYLMELITVDRIIGGHKGDLNSGSGLLHIGILRVDLPALTSGRVTNELSGIDQTRLINISRHQLGSSENIANRFDKYDDLLFNSEQKD